MAHPGGFYRRPLASRLRILARAPAPGAPFDHGAFDIVVENLPTHEG
jgi:hypothetical protein